MFRIAIFSALFKPSNGGIEVFTENIAQELASLGHKVVVVTSNIARIDSMQWEGGVEVIRLPVFSLLNGRLPLPKKNREYRELWKSLENRLFDYVLVNAKFYPHSLEGIRLAKALGITPIVLEHGSASITLGNTAIDRVLAGYESSMAKRAASFGAAFYGVSTASLHWLKNFNIQGKGTIHNSIDARLFISNASERDFTKELRLHNDAFIVAFTGRLIPEKGIQQLMDAARLLSGYQDVHFLIAGDGPLYETIAKSDLPTVHALGGLDRRDIAALLLQSQVFCLPTRSEGFSTSMLEAAACGAVPIMPNVGGVEELVGDDSIGVILANREPETIAKGILSLYDDRKSLKCMSARLRDVVANKFSWEESATALLKAFEENN